MPQDRHACVTGATRGIGRAVAEALVSAGARVTILGRTQGSAERARAELGAQLAVAADVTVTEALVAALKETAERGGPVEILVNNAGGVASAPFARIALDDLREMMALNLEPLVTATQSVLPSMVSRGFGRIVNVASTAGLKGYPYVAAYCAAKHAVVGLTRALAAETATTGVTVNAVCPGYTDTDLVRDAADKLADKTGRSQADIVAEFAKHNPMGRLVQPAEIAASVVWLAGDAASAMTGQAIAVAGGEL